MESSTRTSEEEQHRKTYSLPFLTDQTESTQFHLPGTILHLRRNENGQWILSKIRESDLLQLSFSEGWFHDHWIFKAPTPFGCDR